MTKQPEKNEQPEAEQGAHEVSDNESENVRGGAPVSFRPSAKLVQKVRDIFVDRGDVGNYY